MSWKFGLAFSTSVPRCLFKTDYYLMIYAATGILTRNNHVLITQRAEHKPFSGFWEFPGGKIESGENALQALTRELKEELGIIIRDPQHVLDYQHAYPQQVVALSFWHVLYWQNEIQSLEQQAFSWVHWDELAQYALLSGSHAVIQQLRELIC